VDRDLSVLLARLQGLILGFTGSAVWALAPVFANEPWLAPKRLILVLSLEDALGDAARRWGAYPTRRPSRLVDRWDRTASSRRPPLAPFFACSVERGIR
jgi:hypothetical protein